MWRVWLDIHILFGLALCSIGLLLLLIATHDFSLVERIGAMRPLSVVFSAAALAVSLRFFFFFFFFYGPVIVAGAATACFTVAAALSTFR